MYFTDHDHFLQQVVEYSRKHPGIAPRIVAATQIGIEKALEDANKRAADMEIALSFTLNTRLNNWKGNVVNILRRWQNKSSFNWDSTIQKLEPKTEKEEQ